jgi:hypothetical protein
VILFKPGDKVTNSRNGMSGTVESVPGDPHNLRVCYDGDYFAVEPEGDWVLTKPVSDRASLVEFTQTYGRYYANLIRRKLIDANIPWTHNTLQAGRGDGIVFYVPKTKLDMAKRLLEE